MDASEKLFASRIMVGALALFFGIVGYVTYTQYSDEIQEEVFEAVAKTFPNLDNEIAKL